MMGCGAKIRRLAGHGLFAAMSMSLAAAVQAQGRSAPVPEASGPYRIAGVLVNSATGAPIRRGTVEALDGNDGHAVGICVTDEEGRFALEQLAAAKYDLSASRRGFGTAYYDQHEQYASAVVTGPEQDTTHLVFRLTPSSSLGGAVTDEAGEAVPGARLMLFRRTKHGGSGGEVEQAGTAIADDTGTYEFGNLAAGEYLLAVMADPWYAIHEGVPSKRNPALDVVYPVTYFDSTTDEAAATPIVLAGGEHQDANISLHAVPALRITLAVPRKADGSLARPELEQTIFGNVVSAESSGFLDAMQTGTVEMSGIAPGHYLLTQGDPPREAEVDFSASQQVEPNSGIPLHALTGSLRMQSGVPTPDEAMVSLERVDNNAGQKLFAAPAHRGRFRFNGVPPGDWTVAVTSGTKALPVLDVAMGAARRTGNLIRVGERAAELTVTLSDSSRDIEGFAKKEGKRFAGAMVVLLPKDVAQWKALTRRDQSNTDGSFTLHDVLPGDYTLLAIAGGWELNWSSPPAMARYLSAGTRVRVTESSGKVVQLGDPVEVEGR